MMHNSAIKKDVQKQSQQLLKAVVANPFAQYRIICFPCAGGNAAMFSTWPKQVPQEVEILALHAPGRGARFLDSPYTSMDELVDDLLSEAWLLAEKPYVIFGHSLGARVGYELVRRAIPLGLPMPIHFIASGSRAPNVPCFSAPTYTLPSTDFMQVIYDMDGVPDEVRESEEMMSLLEPTFRADFKIAETYLGKVVTLECPITVLSGTEDKRVSGSAVEQWQSFSSSAINIQYYAGGHFFINHNDAALQDIVALLTKVVAQQKGRLL